MRYHVPRSVLGSRCERQAGPVDKFGGLPWAFPVTRWPICGECGRPQSHVAQLYHDDERLDLGGEAHEGLLEAVPLEAKVGGPPRWLQSFEEGPPAPWRFVLQLPDSQVGDGPAPTAEETGWGVQRITPDGPQSEYPPGTQPHDHVRVRLAVSPDTWWVLGPNFGMGTAFVFVNTETDPATAVMFWQR